MKRSVLIALAAFALAGCAKESVVDSALTNAGNAIGFNTYSNITRGNPFDNNPEFAASGNVFGVTAFISTSDSPYMGKADAGTEIVSDGTKWDYKNTSDIRYWPTQGETLSFYAYAPYTKNGVAIPVAYTKGDGMIMTDYTVPADDAGQVDLMYASAQGKSGREGSPPVQTRDDAGAFQGQGQGRRCLHRREGERHQAEKPRVEGHLHPLGRRRCQLEHY